MGYHGSGVIVTDTTASDLTDIVEVLAPAGRIAGAGGFLASGVKCTVADLPGAAIIATRSWAFGPAWNTHDGGPLDGDLAHWIGRSRETPRRALFFWMDGSTNTYGIRYVVGRQVVRTVTHRHRTATPLPEQGAPLPEEDGIPKPSWGYDADWVFTLIFRLMGVRTDDLMGDGAVYTVLD